MARSFNGSTDKVKTSIGALNFSGAFTVAIICRTTGLDGQWRNLISPDNGSSGSANVKLFSFELAGAGGTANATRLGPDGSSSFEVASPWTTVAADGWCLHAGSHAGGTALGRLHRYKYSTAAFSHANTGSTYAGGSAPGGTGRVELGGDLNGAGDWFQGDIAAAAIWDRVLTDAEIENLPFTLQAWLASAPKALWLLDQSATGQKIADYTGNGADEATLTGTSVSTGSVPVFNYSDGIWLPTIVTPAGGGSTFNDSMSGTITLSGSSTQSHSHTGTGSGTVTLSGSFTQSASFSDARSGTITLSGSGTESQTHTASGSGSITLSGSSSESYVPPGDSGSGTITLSGAGTESQTHTSSLSGSIVISGSGIENFVPPGGVTTVPMRTMMRVGI